ncbi:MAG: AAA family ATPase [Bacteroidales bacterium]|nr:AAA family ATPase [Bacteroidales bacterium]
MKEKDTALFFLNKVAKYYPDNQFAKAIFNKLKNAGEDENLENWQLLMVPLATNDEALEDFDNTRIERNQDCRFFNFYLKGFRKFPHDKYYGVPFCPPKYETSCPPSTLIQGGNGSGKTSVFSALEYLFTEQISAAKKQRITGDALKDYMQFANNDIDRVDINVLTKIYHFRFNPQEQLKSNLKGLCLASFFCSEYDVDNLIEKGLSNYIYEQMGYSLVKDIINKLEVEIDNAISKHESLGDSFEAIQTQIEELDIKIGFYKKPEFKNAFLDIVSKLHEKQDWKEIWFIR